VSLKFFPFVFLALFSFSLITVAQNYNCTVEGRVISQSSGKPLEDVNVYISNTEWGSTTNKDGYFKIGPLPYGNHTVVASVVGYKSKAISVTIKDGKTGEVNFYLEESSYKLNTVLVTGKIPKDWKDNLKKFKKYFLGQGPYSDECKIINPEVINFTRDKSGDLMASASQPIMIVNDYLGYKIRCDLDNFEFDKESQIFQFVVNTYYKELKDTAGNLKNRWTKNREEAYYGSVTDFIKSLINNTYHDEGFRVYYGNNFKRSMYQSFFELDKPIIKKINDNYFELNFNGYLRIEYDSDIDHKTKVSLITLNYPDVLLDKFGYPVVELPYTVYGEWAHNGMANMLPKYYNPEEEK